MSKRKMHMHSWQTCCICALQNPIFCGFVRRLHCCNWHEKFLWESGSWCSCLKVGSESNGVAMIVSVRTCNTTCSILACPRLANAHRRTRFSRVARIRSIVALPRHLLPALVARPSVPLLVSLLAVQKEEISDAGCSRCHPDGVGRQCPRPHWLCVAGLERCVRILSSIPLNCACWCVFRVDCVCLRLGWAGEGGMFVCCGFVSAYFKTRDAGGPGCHPVVSGGRCLGPHWLRRAGSV